MNALTAFLTRLSISKISTVFLVGAIVLSAVFRTASAMGAPLNSVQLAIGQPTLVATNSQTKTLLRIDEAKFAKAPVDKPIKSEKARDILLSQESIKGIKAPVVRSADSKKTVATFLHLNPTVASAPEPSIPSKLEALKEKLTKRGVEVPTRPQPSAKPMQLEAKPVEPTVKPLDKVSDAIKGLFKDSNN